MGCFPKLGRNTAISVPSNHPQASLWPFYHRPRGGTNPSGGTYGWSSGNNNSPEGWERWYVSLSSYQLLWYVMIPADVICHMLPELLPWFYDWNMPWFPVVRSIPAHGKIHPQRAHRLGSCSQSHCRSAKTFHWCWHWPKNLENDGRLLHL